MEYIKFKKMLKMIASSESGPVMRAAIAAIVVCGIYGIYLDNKEFVRNKLNEFIKEIEGGPSWEISLDSILNSI